MNNKFEDHIKSLSDSRYKLIEKDDDKKASDAEIEQIDQLEKEILSYMKEYFNSMSFEFLLDELTKLGYCPNVVYDDNGHWAIACNGYQNVPGGDDPIDMNLYHIVEKHEWKNSPREALYSYIIS